jgi:hypothetical protein
MKKVLVRAAKILAAIVVLYAVLTAALFCVMLQSPDNFAQTMKHVPWPAFVALPFKPLWNVARRGRLRIGDPAPDFSLESPDHKSRFQLSSVQGKQPAVLVFGSYT